jgi:hypothetical protein
VRKRGGKGGGAKVKLGVCGYVGVCVGVDVCASSYASGFLDNSVLRIAYHYHSLRLKKRRRASCVGPRAVFPSRGARTTRVWGLQGRSKFLKTHVCLPRDLLAPVRMRLMVACPETCLLPCVCTRWGDAETTREQAGLGASKYASTRRHRRTAAHCPRLPCCSCLHAVGSGIAAPRGGAQLHRLGRPPRAVGCAGRRGVLGGRGAK